MSETIFRQAYSPYSYVIPHVFLRFELDFEKTIVYSRFTVTTSTPGAILRLDGEELTLVSLAIDGVALDNSQYYVENNQLCIPLQKASHLVEIQNEICPATNTSLMGLYQSTNQLFTQCEAEGFRRITYFADRPDVLSKYTVELIGNKKVFPYLLSNGNLLKQNNVGVDQHCALWEDPFAKPSYLFAVVAGDFDCREQYITTKSGKKVLLQLLSDKGDYSKTEWAMNSLIQSLRWDEERFNLELDLDRYMVVSASDFNMGAMENKGLNVFNAAYVLADPTSTTDQNYRDIQAVIGHEYFHNWTGNRVTCRDWFQLSLKEGLTVFREQEFSADMLAEGLDGIAAYSAKAVKRIDDVSLLRLAQFPEDAGPLAHPIRPNSYEEIGNFYTATIYEKGAEVIRMFHTLLGEAGFQQAIAHYFERFDGQAITTDDFMSIMDEQYRLQNPGKNLDAFKGWYEQAGTPTVELHMDYNPNTQQATLRIKQYNPPVGIELHATPIVQKPPVLIPFTLGFMTTSGMPLSVQHENQLSSQFTLVLDKKEQCFVFDQVKEKPVLSLLRDFSAPIQLNYQRDPAELSILASYDSNAFARWQAIQELATNHIIAVANGHNNIDSTPLLQVWHQLINDTHLSAAYLSRALTLPSPRQLLAQQRLLDPHAIYKAHQQVEQELAQTLVEQWLNIYRSHHATQATPYSPDALAAGSRALKNLALRQLVIAQHPEAISLARQQYHSASNMTDQWGAFSILVHFSSPEVREQYLTAFYEQWQDNALVIDKWFSIQASAPYFDVEQAKALQSHPAFTLRNPNRARSLIFQFCANNIAHIHTAAGYQFWRDQVIALDALNPEIAARLSRTFDNWAQYVEPLRLQLKTCWLEITHHTPLSVNVSEIANKALSID